VLATNSMGDEMFIATPAVAGNSMYLRGRNTLYCVRQAHQQRSGGPWVATRVGSQAGQGGMGVVYRARDLRSNAMWLSRCCRRALELNPNSDEAWGLARFATESRWPRRGGTIAFCRLPAPGAADGLLLRWNPDFLEEPGETDPRECPSNRFSLNRNYLLSLGSPAPCRSIQRKYVRLTCEAGFGVLHGGRRGADDRLLSSANNFGTKIDDRRHASAAGPKNRYSSPNFGR